MTEEQVRNFEKVQAQFDSLYTEISALSKKKQNDGLSPFKLKFVNKNLEDANNILGDEYKPFEDFSLFDVDNVPTNSDVIMILGQYLSCMEKLRADNVFNSNGVYWYWRLEENKERNKDDKIFIRTSAPKKINTK